jgi:hypothetical protein
MKSGLLRFARNDSKEATAGQARVKKPRVWTGASKEATSGQALRLCDIQDDGKETRKRKLPYSI